MAAAQVPHGQHLRTCRTCDDLLRRSGWRSPESDSFLGACQTTDDLLPAGPLGHVLLPDLEFQCVDSLASIEEEPLSYADAREVCTTIRRLASKGHILLIEKTEEMATTANSEECTKFISRARTIDLYSEYMQPYRSVYVRERTLEPTYYNPDLGSVCYLSAQAYRRIES